MASTSLAADGHFRLALGPYGRIALLVELLERRRNLLRGASSRAGS